MRRLHWSTLLGGVIGGVLALVLAGPVAVAVLMLRCCDDSTGPAAGAWIIIGVVLAVLVAVAAVAGGYIAKLVRQVVSAGRKA